GRARRWGTCDANEPGGGVANPRRRTGRPERRAAPDARPRRGAGRLVGAATRKAWETARGALRRTRPGGARWGGRLLPVGGQVLRGRLRRAARGPSAARAGRRRLRRAGTAGGAARSHLRRAAPPAAADVRSGGVGGLRDRASARAGGAGDRT